MKILYVTTMPIEYSFSNNLRNVNLIKGLVENGHTVDIICFKPVEDYIKYDANLDLSAICNINYIVDDIAKPSPKSYSYKERSGFREFLKKAYERIIPLDTRYFCLIKISDIVLSNAYDIMISSAVPISSHYLGEKIRRRNRNRTGRWIQYWGDPLFAHIGKKTPHWMDPFLRRIEGELLKKSEKIVYTSPLTCEEQKVLYQSSKDKMCYIPRPVIPSTDTVGYKKIDYESLTIGYFGQLLEFRNIIPLCKAILNTKHNLEIYTQNADQVLKAKNIKVHGRVDSEKCKDIEREMDVLVCLCNKDSKQIPGKLFDYAIMDSIVLVVLDGIYSDILKNEFEGYGRFVFVKNEEKEIRSILNNMIEYSDTRKVCDEFDYRRVAREIIS